MSRFGTTGEESTSSHSHGNSSQQVAAGLAGAIIVEGGLDDLPEIAGLTERLFVLQGPF